MGSILIVLLVFSSVGYSFLQNAGDDSSTDSIKENGLTFIRYGEYWKTIIQNSEFYFKYLPSEVSNISVMGTYNLQEYSGKPLYFVNPGFATGEILQNINSYVSRYQEACIYSETSSLEIQNKNCSELPIKNCSEDNVIIFTNSTQMRVWKEGSCVYLSEEYTQSADAFLYSMLRVI